MAQAHIVLHASEIGNWAAQERLSYFLASDLFVLRSGLHVTAWHKGIDMRTTIDNISLAHPEYHHL